MKYKRKPWPCPICHTTPIEVMLDNKYSYFECPHCLISTSAGETFDRALAYWQILQKPSLEKTNKYKGSLSYELNSRANSSV